MRGRPTSLGRLGVSAAGLVDASTVGQVAVAASIIAGVSLDAVWLSRASSDEAALLGELCQAWHERGLAAALILSAAPMVASAPRSKAARGLLWLGAIGSATLALVWQASATPLLVSHLALAAALAIRSGPVRAEMLSVVGSAAWVGGIAHSHAGWPPGEGVLQHIDHCANAAVADAPSAIAGALAACVAFAAAVRVSRGGTAALLAGASVWAAHEAAAELIEARLASRYLSEPTTSDPLDSVGAQLAILDVLFLAAILLLGWRSRAAAPHLGERAAPGRIVGLCALVAAVGLASAVDMGAFRCQHARECAHGVRKVLAGSPTAPLRGSSLTMRLPVGPQLIVEPNGRMVVVSDGDPVPYRAESRVPYHPTDTCIYVPRNAPLEVVESAVLRLRREAGWAQLCALPPVTGSMESYALLRSAFADALSSRLRAIPIAIGEMNGARVTVNADGYTRPTRALELSSQPSLPVSMIPRDVEVLIARPSVEPSELRPRDPQLRQLRIVTGLRDSDLALVALALLLSISVSRFRRRDRPAARAGE